MKVKVLVPFYSTETGIIKRGEAEFPDKFAKQLIMEGKAEVINERNPAAKSKNSPKSRNTRV